MTRDFLAELKARIAAINKIEQPKQPRYDIKTDQLDDDMLYNIHKRSLPVGLDKVIVVNVTKDDVAWWVKHKLKTECKQDGTLIYYDAVPVNATQEEKGVFWNPKKIMEEN